MSQFWVPGPVRISVGPTTGSLSFLGWASDGVLLAVQPRFEDVMSDLSGPAVPEEIQFLGKDAVVRFVLGRYNENVLATVNAFLQGGTEGAWGAQKVGALLNCEGHMYRLLLQCPYAAKSCMSGLRATYNFPLAYPADAIDVQLSTRVKRPRVTFRCIADILSADGSATLFNTDTTGAPSNITLSS